MTKKPTSTTTVICFLLSLFLPLSFLALFSKETFLHLRYEFLSALFIYSLCGFFFFLALKAYERSWVLFVKKLQSTESLQKSLKDSMATFEKECALKFEEKMIDIQKEQKVKESAYLREEQEWKKRELDLANDNKKFELEKLRLEADLRDLRAALQKAYQLAAEKEEHILDLQTEIANVKFELRTVLKLETVPKKETQLFSGELCQNTFSFTKPTQDIGGRSQVVEKPIVKKLDEFLVMASKLAESSQLRGKTSRFFDASIDSYAVEKRRLFAVLEQHQEVPSFVFCRLETKLLYASDALKKMMNISGDVFQKDVFSSALFGKKELLTAVKTVLPFQNKLVSFALNSKNGKMQKLSCHLGACPLPPFSSCVIGILEEL